MSYCSIPVEDEDRRCRHCHSQSLKIDWAQGDRVCTNCGIVDAERLLDDRPEWKDFNEDADIIKGGQSGARSGMVQVNENKYHGGLQPTSLSKQAFGTPFEGSSLIRSSLSKTNRNLDLMVQKQHKNAMKRARLSRLIQKKTNENDEDENIRPEHDMLVLQEEEHAQQAYAAIHSEKWSLERAIILHGTGPNQAATNGRDREELLPQLTHSLKCASSDLYKAYSILNKASQKLELPPRVVQDAANFLCQYAARKDGLTVRGVSSRLSSTQSSLSKEAKDKLRIYNQHKQMSSLGSALLFLEARKQGHKRLLQEVCKSFDGPVSSSKESEFLKVKHTSKAMKELRILFPDYMQANTALPDDGLIEHVARKLQLPPVAAASIEVLVQKLRKSDESFKLATLYASVTLFVTMAGTVMQRLASQAAPYQSSPPPAKRLKTNIKGKKKKASFDLFSHDAIPEDRAYEMRQMWDAWTEQMPWCRTLRDIEQFCNVKESTLLNCYKTKIYPQRDELLSTLQSSSSSENDNQCKLKSTPRAHILFRNLASSAALLDKNGKVST